jgi:hypothetical protein
MRVGMEEPKPKHRWFRFSLRSLIVFVTILCVPLGWVSYHFNLVRQRTNFMRNVDAENPQENQWWLAQMKKAFSNLQPKPISDLRRSFGDREYSIIILPPSYDESAVDKANQLFTEAMIWKWRGQTHGVDERDANLLVDVTKRD